MSKVVTIAMILAGLFGLLYGWNRIVKTLEDDDVNRIRPTKQRETKGRLTSWL